MIGSIANNRFLQRVNPEITRAVADSGSSLNHSEIQKLMRQMVDLGIADNLKLWVHSGLVKTRTSGSDTFVSKAYDVSGQENDAVQATTDNQPLLVAKGLSFGSDSANLMASNTNVCSISNNFSISFWCKYISGAVIIQHAIGVSNRWGIAGNSSIFSFYAYDGAWVAISSGEYTESVYNHIVVNYNNNKTSTIYINGDLKSGTTRVDATTVNAFLSIGSRTNGSNGSIMDINDARIFNTVLTASQISAIYNLTSPYYT